MSLHPLTPGGNILLPIESSQTHFIYWNSG